MGMEHGEDELLLLEGGGLKALEEVATPLAIELLGFVREDDRERTAKAVPGGISAGALLTCRRDGAFGLCTVDAGLFGACSFDLWGRHSGWSSTLIAACGWEAGTGWGREVVEKPAGFFVDLLEMERWRQHSDHGQGTMAAQIHSSSQ
ncbi:MAG: hypothetical protein JNL98_17790 [Bryobacterales bacterium]|nr:hypothetical protein [Bryobacterales bacterium]